MSQLAPQDKALAQPNQSERPGTVAQQVQALWSGPLPPPGDLAAFNNAFPGCAERIVAMAERQSLHRQAMESSVVRHNMRNETLG
jgi:uncharacterized membrane protein